MGKKSKKKAGISLKERRGQPVSAPLATSPNSVSQPSIPSVETLDDGSSDVKEKKLICPHFDKGVDLVKVSAKLRSSKPFKCEDCREGAADRRASKGGKGKHGKKKAGGSADSKSATKAFWICLECGLVSCGGAGLPTIPQSHAVRHSRQTRHPLAMQIENPNLRWCFPCSTLIPALTPSENGEQLDVLSEIVKLLKAPPPSEPPSSDVEDVWFKSGSVTSEIKSGNIILEGSGGYVVRGLANLGNTCFFNSVLQNLLAMGNLRDYFSSMDGVMGPLTISLKKFFSETSPASGMRNVISPRSLFGCLCSKAPQFRGYQQHDSHELLRCLLDGLCTEESTARKQAISLKEAGNAPKPAPTFVDAIFGGQLSSSVSCLECGHASVVYEPFLDLSLPLPTKRSLSKKPQAVSRAKKTKLPPRRSGRFRSKINIDADSSPANRTSKLSSSGNASQIQSIESVVEKLGSPASDSTHLESVLPDTNGDINGSAPRNLSACQGNENKKVVDSIVEEVGIPSGCSAELDCVKPATVLKGHEAAPQLINSLVGQGYGKDNVQADVSLQHSVQPIMQADSCPMEEPSPLADIFSWMDYIGGADDYDMASQIDDEASVQDSGNRNEAVQNPDLLNHKSELNNGMGHFSNSWEDEYPVQVQASEILLLPYKEGTSTEVDNAHSEQDSLEFGGFGDLFDEPEVSNTSEANGVADVESDPDEVDNTDSPVSVESCLAYFMKPEILSKTEHGWQCEQCSKTLLEQRMRLKKPASRVVSNGAENRNPNAPSESGKDCSPSIVAASNGFIERDVLGNSVQNLVLHNGNGPSCMASGLLEGKNETNCELPQISESSSSYKTCCEESFSGDSSSAQGYTGCKSDEVGQQKSQKPHESEESDNEEIDSGSIKVTRDATKRILINKAPPILTIHLKRFTQDARGRLSKLNGHVDFRETLDFRPYTNPSCIVGGDKQQHKFRLVGVVEHSGTMRGGHYVAYVRGGGKTEKEKVWYYASDAYVRESCLEEVLRCEAYILFYEHFPGN